MGFSNNHFSGFYVCSNSNKVKFVRIHNLFISWLLVIIEDDLDDIDCLFTLGFEISIKEIYINFMSMNCYL